MALLLAICGGMAACGLVGCTDGVSRPFRPVHADAGSDVPTADADGGPLPLPDASLDTGHITCPTTLVGYASMGMDGGTTGGGDAGVVTASTLAQLRTYANQVGPAVVRISGTINIPAGEMPIEVESDKTLLAANPNDGLEGNGFIIKDKRNVIVRNLKIAKALAPWDAITVQSSTNVWIDHCDLSSDRLLPKGTYDGLIDITHGARNVTVSWNYFHEHYNPCLVGHTDDVNSEDSALAVTFHHNLFKGIQSGAPRARFGHVHVFSNHFVNFDSYAIASVMGATLLIEGNFFEAVAMPIMTRLEATNPGGIDCVVMPAVCDGTIWAPDMSNHYQPNASAADNVITTPPRSWTPPYPYIDSVDVLQSVVVVVDYCAGVNKVP